MILGSAAVAALCIELAAAQHIHTPEEASFADFVARRVGPERAADLLITSEAAGTPAATGSTTVVAPNSPFSRYFSMLPAEDSRTEAYVKDLRDFLERRELLLGLEEQYEASRRLPSSLAPFDVPGFGGDLAAFSQRVLMLNGVVFWAPASKSDDLVTRAGDEIRAVFGPIPPFDVTTLGERTLPDGTRIVTAQLKLEVDGNFVELKPNPDAPGAPLQFEHRDLEGRVVRWTETIDRCDKPSLAGGVTPCGAASRIARITLPTSPVEWIALARKTKVVEILEADSYWSPHDPTYALVH